VIRPTLLMPRTVTGVECSTPLGITERLFGKNARGIRRLS
jgi:hypothetical protein